MTRVLVVDDEELMLRSLLRSLSATFEIHVASSGSEALDKLRAQPGYVVIMSDLNMPNMNGARFLQLAHALSPDSMQILLTGTVGFERVLGPAEENGIFLYLTKPCRNSVIVDGIHAAVAEHARRAAS